MSWTLAMPWKIRIRINLFCINYTCYLKMLDYGFNKVYINFLII